MDDLSLEQFYGLEFEIETAIMLTDAGIRSIWDLDGANDFKHLPLQLLAQGLERFLKLTYALGCLQMRGDLPSSKELRTRFGHDLVKLSDSVIELGESNAEFVAREACRRDIHFLKRDADLRRLLDILSHFAVKGRYHNLELILGADPQELGDGPEQQWEQMEMDFLHRHPEWVALLGKGPEFSGWYEEFAREVTGLLQRFARTIARMWTLGPLGARGLQFTGKIKRFLSSWTTNSRLSPDV